MILNIFNRKELAATFSMAVQAQIRDTLKQNNIKYALKTLNRNSTSPFGSSRIRTGTFGQNMDLAYEYTFYVHKQDLEQAKYLISGIR